MTTIGLRVYSNSKIYYCLLEKDPNGNLNYLDISYINMPLSLKWPEALNFLRNTMLDLLLQYSVDNAIIRISEFGARFNKIFIDRSYIEGVLQETLASSNVKKYIAATIASFTPLLGMQRDQFKKYAADEMKFTKIPTNNNWSSFSHEERETILIANAALNL